MYMYGNLGAELRKHKFALSVKTPQRCKGGGPTKHFHHHLLQQTRPGCCDSESDIHLRTLMAKWQRVLVV